MLKSVLCFDIFLYCLFIFLKQLDVTLACVTFCRELVICRPKNGAYFFIAQYINLSHALQFAHHETSIYANTLLENRHILFVDHTSK